MQRRKFLFLFFLLLLILLLLLIIPLNLPSNYFLHLSPEQLNALLKLAGASSGGSGESEKISPETTPVQDPHADTRKRIAQSARAEKAHVWRTVDKAPQDFNSIENQYFIDDKNVYSA